MKRLSIILVLAILTTNAIAERIQDTVHSISYGKNGEDHLVYLTNGRVLFFDQSEVLPKVGTVVEVDFTDDNQVNAISSLPSQPLPLIESEYFRRGIDDGTVLNSYTDANAVFRGMNRSWRNNTECTDRAHIWSYEEWRRRGLISRKVFLFFTNTYIRRYNYHWWFHVSPYTLVNSSNGIVEYVLDRRYTSTPRTMKSWTDLFIRSRRNCPVTTYRHYRENKNSVEHCFAVKSNMYNRLPYHVRMEEDSGRTQSRFNMSEVNFSYRAFSHRTLHLDNF
jgi:hypothetical protein